MAYWETEDMCPVPGCINPKSKGVSGVCKWHLHTEGYCQCDFCRNGRDTSPLRIRTEEELVDLGLLPPRPGKT